MTYHEEMKAKYPDRPYIGWQTIYLKNMVKALGYFEWSNTPEEAQRKLDAEHELKCRRSRMA